MYNYLFKSLFLDVTPFVKAVLERPLWSLQANEQHEEGVDAVINVTDRLISSTGDAHEMVKQAKHLAQVRN